jgi:large subunit ribosomal protein L4
MSGHRGDVTKTVQNLDVVRIDEARSAAAGARRRAGREERPRGREPAVKARVPRRAAAASQREPSDAARAPERPGPGDVQGRRPDTAVRRDYNEALVHQIVVAFQANARQGTRAQLDRAMVKHSTKKPWRQKGTGRARAGMTSSPLWRGGGRIFPNRPTRTSRRRSTRRCTAPAWPRSSRSSPAKAVWRWSIARVDSPKTKALAAKLKAMGLDSVLVIADQLDDNLLLALAQPRERAGRRAAYADPLSLVHYKKVLVTKAAIEQLKEMLA